MTKTEAAQRLGVSRQTIHEWITKGMLATDADGNITEADILRVQERQPSRQADTARRHDSIALYEARIDELKEYNAFLVKRLLFMEQQLSIEQEQRSVLQRAIISLTSDLQHRSLPAYEPLALPANETLDEPCLSAIEGAGEFLATTGDLGSLVTGPNVWEVTEEEPLEDHIDLTAAPATLEAPTPTIETKVLTYLQAHPEIVVDAKQIAVAIAEDNIHTMRTLLGRLAKYGKIARLAKGRYGWRVS